MMRKNNRITKEEIAKVLNMTKDGIKYHLKKLTNSGYVRFEGNSKNGHWEILKED